MQKNNTITFNKEVYAVKVSADTLKAGSEWIGEPHESLQAQRMKYKKGKEFKPHYHILNPRTIKRTQEAFVVISGIMEIFIYTNDGVCEGTFVIGPGEAVFVYRGGHGIRILEDCVAYEIKAGQFTYVSEDKEYINDQK